MLVAEAFAAIDPAAVAGPDPDDQRLAHWFRARPRLGRRDRLAIADVVFRLLRHRRLYEALARRHGGATPADRQLLARLAVDYDDPDPQALIARVETETGALPPAERLSLPDWLWACLVRDEGQDRAFALALGSLQAAPTDIRVNVLKARPEAVQRLLGEAGIDAQPIAGLPQALRIDRRVALELLPAFRDGAFERQDAGSQRICAFAAPRRGQIVVDFCAGAGGKTLAMAALMRNQGRILAFDRSAARLERLRERCRRAGVTIVVPLRIDDEGDPRLVRYRDRADLVLVDAPCSGTGTLRRDPGRKWRLQEHDISHYARRQSSIVAAAARLVRPGGRLVYASCSLLRCENEAVMATFDAEYGRQGLQIAQIAPSSNKERATSPVVLHAPPIGAGVYVGAKEAKWTPDRDGTDGFFVGVRTRLVADHYNP